MTSASKRGELPPTAITLVVLNVAMFVWQVAMGADIWEPSGDWMKAHGGNFGPLTLDGEPWRLATSMFLHFGVLHLLMNMFGLFFGGIHVERMYGRAGFIALYVVSGLASGLASAIHGDGVAAGASGAIFGIFGAFGAFLLLNRKRLDREAVSRSARGLLILLAVNISIGLSWEGIDNFAHGGGLVAGFLCGLALELGRKEAPSMGLRTLLVGVLGVGLVLGATFVVGAPPDRVAQGRAFNSVVSVENAVSRQWQDLARKANAGEVTDAAFADTLEKDILPPWREATAKYMLHGGGERYVKMLAYLRAREQAWSLLVKATREDNEAIARLGASKLLESAALLAAVNAIVD